MDLVSRLKQYLDSQQISVTQFADECGIPRPTASQLLAGRNKKVSDEIIGKIHQCYPELNVIWLMFGEGSMVTAENIQFSEPQNSGLFSSPSQQTTEKEINTSPETPFENDREIKREKFEEPQLPLQNIYDTENNGGEFRFSDPVSKTPPSTFMFDEHPRQKASSRQRVIGIVVYYDDSTFESFVPDPDHSAPFIR